MTATSAAALSVLLGSAGQAAGAPPLSYAVDPGSSRVHVHLGRSGLLKALGHDHEIEAPVAEGRVDVVEGDPARSSVRLRIEAVRLAVVPGTEPAKDIPKVEERMRGPEVLDAARHPDIAFVSSAVTGQPDGPGHYRLLASGSLQLKGRSFPVEIPLDVRVSGGEIHASGEVEWRLRRLGIDPPSVAGVVKVADRFRIRFDVTARAQDP